MVSFKDIVVCAIALAAAAAPSPAPVSQAASQQSEGAGKVLDAESNRTAKAREADAARAADAEAHAAWCHREYVSEKDCDRWVANQLALRAARKADEERRRQDRREDEARRQEERHEDETRRREKRREDENHRREERHRARTQQDSHQASTHKASASSSGSKSVPTMLLAAVADTQASDDAGKTEVESDSEADAAKAEASRAAEAEAASAAKAEAARAAKAEAARAAKAEAARAANAEAARVAEAEKRAAWCHREYVSEKDCGRWVANQLALRAARKADEERRRQDRREDEARRREERREDEDHRREERHQARPQQDSHPDATHKASGSSSSSTGSKVGPTMLLAAAADTQASDAARKTDAKSDTEADAKRAAEAEERAAWCRREYVSEEDCHEWAADQLARRAAREADEKKRQQERHEDEARRREERREDEARRKPERHADEASSAAEEDDGKETHSARPVFAGPVMMLAAAQNSTNSSVRFTEEQQHQLDAILAKLRKHAAHEEKYAAEDGEDAVDFFRKEYARKEQQAILEFKRKVAADAAKVDASHAADGQSSNLTNGSDAMTDENGKSAVADAMTMLVGVPGSNTSDMQLTEEQQQELKSILAKLRKHAEHEEKYAVKDGEEAVDFFKKEYARKEEHAIADFKRKVAAAAKRAIGSKVQSGANSTEKGAASDGADQQSVESTEKTDASLRGAAANFVAVSPSMGSVSSLMPAAMVSAAALVAYFAKRYVAPRGVNQEPLLG